jgi:hypothetical protein
MVTDLRTLGKLNNCLAVCDVSGSMSGLPMEVCVSLGLLLSELCDEPWHHRVITFSARPQLHLVSGNTLAEKARFIRDMDWGYNTDFQAVFDKLLGVAVAGKLPPERLVRKVFVFSDMEFDQASSRPWETDHGGRVRRCGAGDSVLEPEGLHVRASDRPAEGVALVSGFSKNMVKLFLDGKGIASPRAVMEKAISAPEYQALAVFD